MAKATEQAVRDLEFFLRGVEIRIRRYTMDRKLDKENLLRLAELHKGWMAIRKTFYAKRDSASIDDLRDMEDAVIQVDREIDLVQRELVSEQSFKTGTRTVLALAVALLGLITVYAYTHGVSGLNVHDFEPLAEWGPLKYVEVAFWAEFGALCYLLFLGAHYVARRDFDEWYQPWYLATALRAPLLTVVLMVLVLEFAEWYGEDKWIETFLLEDGNKFYFIAFMSFSLGLASDRVASVARELADSVADFVQAVVRQVAYKLKTAVGPSGGAGK